MPRAARKEAGGRGSAEAIEKRRVARQLNTLFSGGGAKNGKLDGRTEKRRKRLLKEIKEGKSGEPLKAIDLISHANELLDIGETISSIKKNGVKTPKGVGEAGEAEMDLVRRAQAAYNFRPEVWKLLGVDLEAKAAKPAKAAKKSTARKRKR